MSLKGELQKVLATLRSPLGTRIRRPPQKHGANKLVMTLLVRNECDIVRDNIEFHLAMGVDHILATDNGSTDGTGDILQEYARRGFLTYIHDPTHVHAQERRVNKMADMAWKSYGPCFVFHCDGDEFWHSQSGNLKNELSSFPGVDCLEVKVHNVLLLFRNFAESYPEDALLCVRNPVRTRDLRADSLNRSLYIFPYPGKVLYRARKWMPHVVGGNHYLLGQKRYVTRASGDIVVYHVPIRGLAHFQRKVIEGATAVLANPLVPPAFCWHWRRWYQSIQEGKLHEEYRRLVLNRDEAQQYARDGNLTIEPQLPGKLCFNR